MVDTVPGLPATKRQKYADELSVPWLELTPFRLRQVLADLKGTLRTQSPLDAQMSYVLMGMAHFRLGDPEEAVRQLEVALRLRRDRNALVNLGMLLMTVGRNSEAIEILVEASEDTAKNDPLVYANLSEAFAVMGREDDAWDMLRQAISFADHANVMHLFVIACQSAELSADELALQYFVRFLSILTGKPIGNRTVAQFLEEERPANLSLKRSPMLAASVERMLAFGALLAPLREAASARKQSTEVVSDDAVASALAILEDMRPARARATEAAMTPSAAGSA